MASAATNELAKYIAENGLSGATIKMFLLSGNTTSWQTVATLRDYDFVNDVSADEPTGWTNYARQTMASTTFTTDNTNDRGEVDSADVTFTSLDSSGSTVDGVGIMVEVTDDTDSPFGVIDVTGEATGDRTPDGNDFVVTIGSDGWLHLLTT